MFQDTAFGVGQLGVIVIGNLVANSTKCRTVVMPEIVDSCISPQMLLFLASRLANANRPRTTQPDLL